MYNFINIVSGVLLPIFLIIGGTVLAKNISLFKILSPVRFFKALREAQSSNGVSPFKAMCTALAGTLGVGNIAGVSTAIYSGGAGAVMWMWIGAVFSMSVKYAEVALSIKYRTEKCKCFEGGTPYTVKNGFSKYIGKGSATILAGIFAGLCIINSLVTGNLLQVSAASNVFGNKYSLNIIIFLAFAIVFVALFCKNMISEISYRLIPFLSLSYIIISLCIIIKNVSYVPSVLSDIVTEAFDFKALIGGVYGCTVREAIRFGVTRGIFSSESGCGTSPTAHASANAKSAHHQGVFGIFEVIADTLILCSMTAFVILICQKRYPFIFDQYSSIKLAMESYRMMLGNVSYYIIGFSVILFAFATLIAQLYYAKSALTFLGLKSKAFYLYILLSGITALGPIFIPEGFMWISADVLVSVMTIINSSMLVIMRKEVRQISRC